jgi:hypothetical protein
VAYVQSYSDSVDFRRQPGKGEGEATTNGEVTSDGEDESVLRHFHFDLERCIYPSQIEGTFFGFSRYFPNV